MSKLQRPHYHPGSDNPFTDPANHGLVLLIRVVDEWGTECLNWLPTTLYEGIVQDFGVHPQEDQLERLLAAINILNSDEFFVSLPSFIRLANGLSGSQDAFWIDLEEAAWALTEGQLIHPEEGEGFSLEIRAYLGKILDDNGILHPPDVLRVALREDGDLAARIQEDFSDDPELVSSIWQNADDRRLDVEQYLEQRALMLLDQLERLRLHNGSAQDVARALKNGLIQRQQSRELLSANR